ncbi:hypothetical protein E2C01_055147 [Portunus trituberculatus]|uniref:Uncharacterized protein n=1 Tax=Portunus trituberculatus TaxID=210409 RepID=A0A5B7GWV0_PORTR|nr:hypothetical protein [Portunus trituberculatus]
MLTVQAMIHGQDAGAALRKPDKTGGVGLVPALRGNKAKRKSGKKKKDAAAGGDDTIGDIFVEVPQEATPRGVPEPGSVVAREWLLLKNTDVPEEQRSPPTKITKERRSSCGGRPGQDPASPPSLVPIRRKDSRPAKSNRTKDANGNRIGKGLRGWGGGGSGGQENAPTEVHEEVAVRTHRSAALEEREEAPRPGDVTLIRVQPPPDGGSEAPGTDSPSRIPRKGSLHFTPEVIFEEGKEKQSGASVSPGVKRHSSSRSTGSEGSTLRRRRRGTARSSASTQTPTGSHSELADCTIPSDKRASVRTHEAPPAQPEEPPPRKDLTGSIPGASLLLKLVMPREKRSSKHSGGSPPHEGAQQGTHQGSTTSHGRSPSSPPVPWFWPPLRHIEAMTSLHSVFPGAKGPPPPPSPRCQGVAAGGGEAEAPGGMAMFPGDVVPFPPRAAPPVPRQVQGDQLSLSSLNSSLAGHTYEQVNFVIEPPICEYREHEYELSKSVSEDIHSYHIDKEEVMPKESYFVPRRSSDSRVAEVAERRTRRASRRKRKKSRCAATITDESLVGECYPGGLLCPENQASPGTQRLVHSDDDESGVLSSPATPPFSPVVSVAHRDLRWSSTTCSSSSSALGERHVATLEKPMTLVSETTLELGRSPSVSPPLPECVTGLGPPLDPAAPTRDAAFIHRLLTLVKEDDSQSSGSGGPAPPETRHNIRRRGVYVPADTESDTGVTSEPEPSRGARITPSPDPRSEGDIRWPRRTSLATSVPERRLCPLHGASSPRQASLAAASQRRRLRRASLPVPVPQEPRPSFFQRLRRSLRRSRNVEPLIAELPSPADVLGTEDVVPAAASEDPLPPPGVACSCPDPVEEFRRFRPRLGSVVTVGSSDEDDKRPHPPTPQVTHFAPPTCSSASNGHLLSCLFSGFCFSLSSKVIICRRIAAALPHSPHGTARLAASTGRLLASWLHQAGKITGHRDVPWLGVAAPWERRRPGRSAATPTSPRLPRPPGGIIVFLIDECVIIAGNYGPAPALIHAATPRHAHALPRDWPP